MDRLTDDVFVEEGTEKHRDTELFSVGVEVRREIVGGVVQLGELWAVPNLRGV
jgi:hypothetical protein